MSIPEASEDNGPFRLVIPSSLYSQQSRMVPPIHNVTVHRELMPITRTAKPYRSNVHRELMPITRTAEPYRSNIHRELTLITHTTEPYRSNVRITEPYRSNVHTAEPYRRESMPIIREPYSSNWTRDENDSLHHRHLSDLQDIKFEEDQRSIKRRKGKNTVRDSGDEMEVDEEEARIQLIYDEKFSSESNDEILRQIIPRLIEAIKPRYTPRYRQVKFWLAALHKHRRVRLLYKQRDTLDKDNHHLHQNNRLNEKKARRVKGIKLLFDKNDEKLENYDRKELLNVLSDN
ncbi:hypothetical protein C1646_765545 [Rhizophagus diaphanus]|nr:hypothetical protein C1646_765545 [Rhizophagus diaphanus] [Rhizophagus sp. MUCL 43196]